jgi:hypothetical protein
MHEESREAILGLRDSVVRAFAQLGLIMALGVMGALFIGGTPAQGDTGVADARPEPAAESIFANAHPLGLVLIAVIVVGGIGVLLVGAFKPDRRADSRDLAELLRD